MTVNLSAELSTAVAAAAGVGLRLKDPATDVDYVLIKADIFDRIRHLLTEDGDENIDMRQVGMLIHEAMREDDENDPLLQSYQNYSRKK